MRRQDDEYTYRQKNAVTLGAFLFQPLADAGKPNASGFPDNRLAIRKAAINEWPKVLHVGSNTLAATFNSDTTGHHCGFS